MMIAYSPAQYEKALAWIVREGRSGKVPHDVSAVAGWRVVNLTAALFDKSARDVAYDVVQFAKEIDRKRSIYP